MKALAVIDQNRALGFENNLIFDIPSDLAHFKKHTLGNTVVMGEKTLASMPGGHALKGRNTLVFNIDAPTGKLYDVDDVKDGCGKKYICYSFNTMEDFKQYVKDHKEELGELIVSGGAIVYKLLLDECDELVLTEVQTKAQCADVYFPEFKHKFSLVKQDGPYQEGDLTYYINTYKHD